MSVLLETSVGDIVIDLETKLAPKACENFLKLGAAKKYNFNSFFSVQRDFLAQAGDPSSKQDGSGGVCFWNTLPPENPAYSKQPYFVLRKEEQLNHRRGTVSFALSPINGPSADGQDEEEGLAGSQFFICLTDDASYLDGKHAVFGNVVEGQEEGGALDRINNAYVDEKGRPLLDIRIKHVEILEDPFSDPSGYVPPSRTPSPTPSQLLNARADASEELVDPSTRPAEEVEREKRKADSSAAALTLEMVGDLPHADVRPPENVLFVCKLNPVTRSEDLQLIFSRFGEIMSCEVIRDRKTGDSLQYAFIEFDEREQAEQGLALPVPRAVGRTMTRAVVSAMIFQGVMPLRGLKTTTGTSRSAIDTIPTDEVEIQTGDMNTEARSRDETMIGDLIANTLTQAIETETDDGLKIEASMIKGMPTLKGIMNIEDRGTKSMMRDAKSDLDTKEGTIAMLNASAVLEDGIEGTGSFQTPIRDSKGIMAAALRRYGNLNCYPAV
ncbi:cyclophilin-like protein [Ceraceosorus bombacis]|uniref:Peptidyl-prolyl cis-trans isomerase n=1 Tax=Ceraceosorus bombacis TaxID=401625 RepID=A0A0P1B843_9BASI|nr:cyclophilin-like protein [Ceraceosorus bombacis]